MMTRSNRDHRIHRRTVLQAGGALAVAGAVTGAAPTAIARTNAAAVDIENLGTAVQAFTVIGSAVDGGQIYLGSRNLNPAIIATYDLTTRHVTHNAALPQASGFVQGLAVLGDTVYAGTSHGTRADFWKFDTSTGQVTRLPNLPLRHVRSLAASPDGKVYAVGIPNQVYEYDPATGNTRDLGVPDANAHQNRSVTATETHVYVGSGSNVGAGGRAELNAIDRTTGEVTGILPSEMANDGTVYWQKLSGRRLVIATDSTGRVSGRLAVINLDDPADYEIVHPVDATHYGAIEVVDDMVYFLALDGGLRSYRIGSGEATLLATPLPLVAGQALAHHDGVLTGVAFTAVWNYSLADDTVQFNSLMDVGAQGGPAKAMSIAASDREVYVAGTGVIGVRDLGTGTLSSMAAVPGEAKDMTFVGRHRNGELWLAQYGAGSRFWRYAPGTDADPSAVVALPAPYNRPIDVAYDDRNGLVVALVRADTTGDRRMFVFDPSTGQVSSYDPIGGASTRSSLTCMRGVTYVGGPDGMVAAWDLAAGEELWRLDAPISETVMGLAGLANRLYCTAGDAFFVIDPNRRRIVNLQESGFVSGSRLKAGRKVVYGANRRNLFRIDRDNFRIERLVRGLNGYWFSNQYLAVVGDTAYTLKGSDVIRVSS